jgi:hypothetical protein
LDSSAAYARHFELLRAMNGNARRIAVLDSVEVALGVIETAGFRPGLGAELLEELWHIAGHRWVRPFGFRLGKLADLVRDYAPDDDEWVEQDDRPELLSLAAGVITQAVDRDVPRAERASESTGLLIDLHQHVDAVVEGEARHRKRREPLPPGQQPPTTPEEAYCLTRQVAVFESLAGSRRPPLAEIRASSRQGRQHLVSVVSHLLSTGQL